MSVWDEIVTWLIDGREHKRTFDEYTRSWSKNDYDQALVVLNMLRTDGLINREYPVKTSFVAYSKFSYSILMSVLLGIDKA